MINGSFTEKGYTGNVSGAVGHMCFQISVLSNQTKGEMSASPVAFIISSIGCPLLPIITRSAILPIHGLVALLKFGNLKDATFLSVFAHEFRTGKIL